MWFIFLDPLPEAPKVGASRGPLFTISREGEGEKRREGRSQKKCITPSRTLAHPPTSQLYVSHLQNLSHLNPTRRKGHPFQDSSTTQ